MTLHFLKNTMNILLTQSDWYIMLTACKPICKTKQRFSATTKSFLACTDCTLAFLGWTNQVIRPLRLVTDSLKNRHSSRQTCQCSKRVKSVLLIPLIFALLFLHQPWHLQNGGQSVLSRPLYWFEFIWGNEKQWGSVTLTYCLSRVRYGWPFISGNYTLSVYINTKKQNQPHNNP